MGFPFEQDKMLSKEDVIDVVDLHILETLQKTFVKEPSIKSWIQNQTEQIKSENQDEVINVKTKTGVFEMNKVYDLQYDALSESIMQI